MNQRRSRVSQLLGPERARDSRSFYQSSQPPASTESNYSSTIISALGDITNQLCHVQATISSLDSKVEDLSVKTTNLTKRVASIEEVTEQQPSKKRKVHIPLELSTIIRRLYKKLAEESRFATNKKFDSDHNNLVSDMLVNQITIAGKYTNEHTVSVAVKRYFDSQVRASKTSSPEEGKKKRLVARRTKLYERQSKFIKGANERNLWKQVSAAYMSDEETDNEGTGFTVHELSWRSNLLNRLLSRLDKRYDEHRKKSTLRTKAREIRILGEYSTRSKPFGAPKWTFQEQSSPTETGSLTESPMLQQSPGSSRDSATPIAHLVHSNLSTPSGSMSHALNPTQLFNGSEVDESDASDDELETLIRAATMKL